tara:strand:- start:1653 stop:2039 length:387 start_codon:yes stop_codon:yes gene_type:complete
MKILITLIILFLSNGAIAESQVDAFFGFEESEEYGDSLRDPFSAPSDIEKQSNTSGMTDSSSLEDYYLSGILVSKGRQYCVVISPHGESIIYKPDDVVNNETPINVINTDHILVGDDDRIVRLGHAVK